MARPRRLNTDVATNRSILWRLQLFCKHVLPHMSKGRFTPWNMKSDHGKRSAFVDWLHGPTSMLRFFTKLIYKASRLFTRCKSNVDQEEWQGTKKWMCWFFNMCPKRESSYKCGFSCLHQPFNSTFGRCLVFKEFFAYIHASKYGTIHILQLQGG